MQELLIQSINQGLEAYGPGPNPAPHRNPTPMKAFGAAKATNESALMYGSPKVDLYDGIRLQHFKPPAEQLPASRCKNGRRNRWFTRQGGRSERGQHRTSDIVCCSTAEPSERLLGQNHEYESHLWFFHAFACSWVSSDARNPSPGSSPLIYVPPHDPGSTASLAISRTLATTAQPYIDVLYMVPSQMCPERDLNPHGPVRARGV